MAKPAPYSFAEMKKQEIENIVTDTFLSGDASWLQPYIDAMLKSGIWDESDVANLVSAFEERARGMEKAVSGLNLLFPKKAFKPAQTEGESDQLPRKKKRKRKNKLLETAATRFKPTQIGYGLESSIQLAPVRRVDVKLDAHTTPSKKSDPHILYAAGWTLNPDDTEV